MKRISVQIPVESTPTDLGRNSHCTDGHILLNGRGTKFVSNEFHDSFHIRSVHSLVNRPSNADPFVTLISSAWENPWVLPLLPTGYSLLNISIYNINIQGGALTDFFTR